MTEPESYRQFVHFIGIDPGPVPGIVLLTRRGSHLDTDVIQCSAEVAPTILYALLEGRRQSLGNAPAIVAIEEFVVRQRASRVSSAHASAVTRNLIGRLERETHGMPNVKVVHRSAAQVKPWATDTRLKAVPTGGTDLLDVVSHVGRHARDAARHALFSAVKDGGLPDPLSTHQ